MRAIFYCTPMIGMAGFAAPRAACAQHVDTVVVGRPALSSAIFAQRADTMDIFLVRGESRQLTGSFYNFVDQTTAGPRGEFTLRSRTGSVLYTTVVRAGTLAPVLSRTQAPTDSAELVFETNRLHGWVAPQGKPLKTIDLPLDPLHYPFAGAGMVLRALPFTPGYAAAILTFDAYVGQPEWRIARVVGSDTVTYRGRPTSTWVVEESTETGTLVRRHWIAKDARQTLKALNLRPRNDGAEQWWIAR